MTTLERIRYRWVHCEDNPNTPWATVVFMTEVEERERIVLLRRLRAVLFGYGPGWTFKDAAIDALAFPVLTLIAWAVLFALWLVVK